MKVLDDLHTKTPEEIKVTIQQINKAFAERDQTIESLRYQLNNALRHRFGRKSEKSDDNQLSLFDEVVQPDNAEEIVQAESEIAVVAHQRKKAGRKPIAQRFTPVYSKSMISLNQKKHALVAAL